MSIVLSILRIIGIVLLVILGLVLLILALVLFSPIKYDISGSYLEKPNIKVKVTYIFRLLRVSFQTNFKETDLKIKLLFFTIVGNKKKENKGSTKKKSQPDNEDNIPEFEEVADKKEAFSSEDTSKKEADSDSKENTENENKTEDVTASDSKKDEPKPKSQKQKSKKQKKSSKKSSKDGIINKIGEYVNLVKESKETIHYVLGIVGRLLKKILPGSHYIKLKLGLDDPATLGEIVGAVAVFRGLTNIELNFTPCFNEKIFEAEFSFKGKIRIISIVVAAIRIYFNKNVKKLIADFKKI